MGKQRPKGKKTAPPKRGVKKGGGKKGLKQPKGNAAIAAMLKKPSRPSAQSGRFKETSFTASGGVTDSGVKPRRGIGPDHFKTR